MHDDKKDSRPLPPTTYPEKHLYYGLSYSSLKIIHQDMPKGYWWQKIMDNKKPPSKSMVLGNALDMVITEPEKAEKYLIIDDRTRSKVVKEEQAQLMSIGYIILKTHEYANVRGMAESVREYPLFAKVIADPTLEAQKTFYARDKLTGLKLQARTDFVTTDAYGQRTITDLKQTQDASPDEFHRQIGKFGYAMQGALYSDVVPRTAVFQFMCVEPTAPYLCAMYELFSEDIARGRGAYMHALWLFSACLKAGRWPGLEQDKKMLELTQYDRKKLERVRTGE